MYTHILKTKIEHWKKNWEWKTVGNRERAVNWKYINNTIEEDIGTDTKNWVDNE